MNHDHTLCGMGPRVGANDNDNDGHTATPEGRRIYGAALRAVAALATYAVGRGNDELQDRAERALQALLDGTFTRPIQTQEVDR
jgi:hypothetical protein